MSKVKVRIENGEAVVTADGTSASCKAATDVEKMVGRVMKSTPTGTKVESVSLKQS